MKRVKQLLSILLAALMMLSFTACGQDKPIDSNSDSTLIKLGDYELLYKDACIMTDYDGKDALVMTLDFTNNSETNASYIWTVTETVMQNDTALEFSAMYIDNDSYESLTDSQLTEIGPGKTIEIKTAFVLVDTTSEIEATFEEIFSEKKGTIKINPSELSRE